MNDLRHLLAHDLSHYLWSGLVLSGPPVAGIEAERPILRSAPN